jgi:hypothetical protein
VALARPAAGANLRFPWVVSVNENGGPLTNLPRSKEARCNALHLARCPGESDCYRRPHLDNMWASPDSLWRGLLLFTLYPRMLSTGSFSSIQGSLTARLNAAKIIRLEGGTARPFRFTLRHWRNVVRGPRIFLLLILALPSMSFAQLPSGPTANRTDAVPRITPAPPKVSSDEIMETVSDIKRAAELSDKIEQAGGQTCRWGLATVDASDIDKGISRFLLKHGPTVPDAIAVSKMLRVRSIVDEMAHQLAVGVLMCALSSDNDAARAAFASGKAVLVKLLEAEGTLDGLACRQAMWEEGTRFRELTAAESLNDHQTEKAEEVVPQQVLAAAREMRAAAQDAERVTIRASNAKGCQLPDKSSPPGIAHLDEVIGHIENPPPQSRGLTASEMWCTTLIAPAVQLDIWSTALACLPSFASKKKGQTVGDEAFQAYKRLTRAIWAFDALALQQMEWEEATAQTEHEIGVEQ